MLKQAMVFAAGMGTRLKPMTEHTPKALVRVGEKPLLEHVLLKLKKAGAAHVVVNVHHFSQQIIDFLRQNDNFGMEISISDESDMLLETGGGIKKALEMFDLNLPVLVHNVDILSNLDLSAFWKTKDGNAYFKNEQNKFKSLLINGRSYRIVSKINSKYNPDSNIEQLSSFNNIKNVKEIEENDDVDSYSGDSDFLKEEEKNNENEIKENEIKENEINEEE